MRSPELIRSAQHGTPATTGEGDTLPRTPKRADFRKVFQHERTCITVAVQATKPVKGTEQMIVNSQEKTNAVNRETIDWDSICWSKHKRIVNRLQARIVKAEDRRSRVPISHTGRLKYASRVIGNFHARFLEGGVVATRSPTLVPGSCRRCRNTTLSSGRRLSPLSAGSRRCRSCS